MDRMISYFIALAVVAGLMFAWDRHPPIGWHAPGILHWIGFELPDSLAVQRDKALRDARTAQDGQKACAVALGSQNAAVSALAARSASALAQAERLRAAVQPRAQHFAAQGSTLAAVSLGQGGQCERWEDADQAVRDALK